MANSQQKNHPNERMKKTSVFRAGDAAPRRDTSSAKSETRVPSDARVTATPASAARGSEGASGGRELREEVAGAAATAARRHEARRGLSFGAGRSGRQRVAKTRERVTRGASLALSMAASRAALATGRTRRRSRRRGRAHAPARCGTKPVRRREGDPRARRGSHGACEGECVVSERRGQNEAVRFIGWNAKKKQKNKSTPTRVRTGDLLRVKQTS